NSKELVYLIKNNGDMKGKTLISGFIMAILGAVIALFAYTNFIEKDGSKVLSSDTSVVNDDQLKPLLTSFQQSGQVDFTYAAEITVHAVVHVRTSTTYSQRNFNPILEWFYGDSYRQVPREVRGYGSGVIISSDGYIITNNHVVENAEKITVKLNDNRELEAKLVGRDPSTDIALLKVDASNLPYINYGDSDKLRLGEWVLAVGNPFNLTSTVTAGIVSAKGRNLGLIDDNYRIESFIQTDAALNVGNSGGALVNTNGLLVGITAAIMSPSGAYAGNSFAIPINIVKKVVEDIRLYGEVQRAVIGVSVGEVTNEIAEKAKLKEIKGAYVSQVYENGAAEEAGIKEGDVITKFNDMPVNSTSELLEQVGRYRPGDKITITYVRSGKENNVSVTLKNIENTTGFVKSGTGTGVVFGAKLEPLTLAEQKTYGVSYGVKVTEVDEGRFRDLGIRKGYIILSVNGRKVKSASDVRSYTNDGQDLTSIEGIQSNGTYFSYQFGSRNR
ncbi:MAG: Do family serine endopeptidase, partial [Bacteroidales bacterium]